jgi:hypothetical protein
MPPSRPQRYKKPTFSLSKVARDPTLRLALALPPPVLFIFSLGLIGQSQCQPEPEAAVPFCPVDALLLTRARLAGCPKRRITKNFRCPVCYTITFSPNEFCPQLIHNDTFSNRA